MILARNKLQNFVLPVLASLVLAVVCTAPALGDPELHRLRQERRLVHRRTQELVQQEPGKSAGQVAFGLLVIPVDFGDARLPGNWAATDISPRLFAEDEQSLTRYFDVASRGRLDLQITLAPLVHLAGDRRDYSDVGYNGYTRTRALATEALQAVRAMGLDFRSLDMDGPDGQPGSADDDGSVDGVLILHAGPGQENDVEGGLIQPLQFYLEDPVVSQGVQASFYAVASLRSGPGIWAHETGHLLGMEDRYDFLLHPVAGAADVRSLGGLGRFSLMASGAWGRGDGWDPALPDAYTCSQLGWCRVDTLPGALQEGVELVPGQAYRIWTDGSAGPEFFLLETRDPQATYPFDSQVPAHQLLLFHVDEEVQEGWVSSGEDPHLRVRLVEADGNAGLAQGHDDGSLADLFPGSLGVNAVTAGTVPSSWGYSGDSLVRLTGITSQDTGVTLATLASTAPGFQVDLSFDGDNALRLSLFSTGLSLDSIQGTITALSTEHGAFAGGETSASFSFTQSAGVWLNDTAPVFELLQDLPSPAVTTFRLELEGPGWGQETRHRWLWSSTGNPLSFLGTWPDDWSVLHPGGLATTTWHRWSGPPYLRNDELPVLVATGEDHDTGAGWPEVNYENSGHAVLRTPELPPGARGVRIVHALETEVLASGEALDGCSLFWELGDGRILPADVQQGYPALVASGSSSALAGRPAFADSVLSLENGRPIWRLDVIEAPAESGPLRLRLVLASNSLWRYRGWMVADLQPLDTDPAGHLPFAAQWDAGVGLAWTWDESDLAAAGFRVQLLPFGRGTWLDILRDVTASEVSVQEVVAHLPAGESGRHLVRVLAETPLGAVASRPVVVYPDGGHSTGMALGMPSPNPSRGGFGFRLRIGPGETGRVGIHDLAGRLLRTMEFPPGDYLARWDGRDERGRRVPAGVYFFRLEGSGPVLTRKVVLLR